VILSISLSCFKWVLQCMLLLTLFWNSPLAIRTIGGRPAYEWVSSSTAEAINDYLTAPISLYGANITLVGTVDVAYFQTGVLFWVIGMLVNVLGVGLYMAFRSTPVLRKAVEEHLALTAVAFTCSVVHPEAMRVLADRRDDVMVLRKLGVLPAMLLDVPIVVLALHWLFQHGFNSFVLFVGCASLAHCLIFTSRSILVLVTARLTREVDDTTPAEGFEEFHRFSSGDLATLMISLFHFGLMLALIGLYYHGWQFGYFVGFAEENIVACSGGFWGTVLVIIAYLIASLSCSVSFLNHFIFSHRGISEQSYSSAVVLLLSCFDASWLALLATDAVAVREVKRAASFVSLGFLFVMLVLQGSIIFLANVPFVLLDEPDYDVMPDLGSGSPLHAVYFNDFEKLISGSSLQNMAFGFTVIVGVAKLLLMVVLQNARKTAGTVSPFVHTPWVLGEQWRQNRSLDAKAAEADAQRRRARDRRSGALKPTHHMGYLLDEAGGNYVFDESGNPVLGNGVRCALDDSGNFMYDDNGGYVLADEFGMIIGEGYGENGDGYGGWVSTGPDKGAHGEDVTNTSRSTDTFNNYNGGVEGIESGAAPAEVLWATCLKRAVYMTPDGVQGVFVSLPNDGFSAEYLFVQAHEIQPMKAKGFGRSGDAAKLRFSFLSVDIGALDRNYVEAHVSNDPEAAWQKLQQSQYPQGQQELAVDSYDGDAYGDGYAAPPYGGAACTAAPYGGGAYGAGAYDEGDTHGGRGASQEDHGRPAQTQLPPPTPDASTPGSDLAQRL